MNALRHSLSIETLPRDRLTAYLHDQLPSLTEAEALAVLENPHVTAQICQSIARDTRLTAFHSIRFRLVQHRLTPLAHSVKLVHYLHWPDLIQLSVDVTVPAQVRHAVETQLLVRVSKLSLGEKIAAAKRCSAALIKVFLFDPDPRVFAALLLNQRLREEDLLLLAGTENVAAEKLQLLAEDRKWSFRYAIRKALVMNPSTPRAAAARQLRFLSQRDLVLIHSHPTTSTYLRRCIERLRERVFARMAEEAERSAAGDQRSGVESS
jgi:hypothetical protein